MKSENKIDFKLKKKIKNTTKIRFLINQAIQKIKDDKSVSNDLIEDIRFIVFDYLDSMENNYYELNLKGEYDEYL
jgi:hypothetical protein